MSNSEPQAEVNAPKPAAAEPRRPERVVLRDYPKIVLLYPTFHAAIVCGFATWFWKESADVICGRAFLIVSMLNLIVLSFEFPRTTSLTLLFFIIALVFGAIWINQHVVTFLGPLRDLVQKLQPAANAQFYWLFAAGLGVIYALVLVDTRFDYWEVMPNELLHHHGILGNVNRFPAPQLKLEKEITDVFEFFLLRSGRLLIHPTNERRAIVLENVPNINRREQEIQNLLRVLDVHIHSDVGDQE
jgi:hypothetical protein